MERLVSSGTTFDRSNILDITPSRKGVNAIAMIESPDQWHFRSMETLTPRITPDVLRCRHHGSEALLAPNVSTEKPTNADRSVRNCAVTDHNSRHESKMSMWAARVEVDLCLISGLFEHFLVDQCVLDMTRLVSYTVRSLLRTNILRRASAWATYVSKRVEP